MTQATDPTNLIAQLVEGLDPGAMVTKYVLVAEVIDTDGDQCIWMNTHSDANAWDTLGLLAYATAVEQHGLRDDGDDE